MHETFILHSLSFIHEETSILNISSYAILTYPSLPSEAFSSVFGVKMLPMSHL
jgi:hypothetical protein